MELPDWVPPEMLDTKAGAFVSVHKFGALRGCIGTIASTQKNLALEIIHNAVSAVAKDPRFEPVEESELNYLDINVDVLGEAESIESEAELDVKNTALLSRADSNAGFCFQTLMALIQLKSKSRLQGEKAALHLVRKLTCSALKSCATISATWRKTDIARLKPRGLRIARRTFTRQTEETCRFVMYASDTAKLKKARPAFVAHGLAAMDR